MVEIWERQKGERDASYIYFSIWLYELNQHPKKLKDVINYIESLTLSDGLRLYKGNLIEVPTIAQLQNFSKRWKWQERETAYVNHLNRIDQEERDQRYHTANNEIVDSFELDLKDWDELATELKESDYSLSTRIRLRLDIQKGKSIAYEKYRLGNGRPISISKSENDHNVEANVDLGGFENFVRALNDSKKQFLKNKQQ